MSDNDKQSPMIAQTHSGWQSKAPQCDACNIIPFPVAPASCRQPAKPESRISSLPLRQAVRKVKDALLRLARRANTVRVQRKRSSATAAAAHDPQHRQPTPQGYGDSAVRRRMSA